MTSREFNRHKRASQTREDGLNLEVATLNDRVKFLEVAVDAERARTQVGDGGGD